MKNYIALTIGPIYKTLSNAKTTQELWASSYMFSYLMKEIIRGVDSSKFIVPYVDKEVMKTMTPIGLFHDRFIYEQSDENDLVRLEAHINTCVADLAIKLKIDQDYLRQYLQIHYAQYQVKSNPLLEISPYLDTLELQYQTSMDGDNQVIKALRTKENYFKGLHFKNERAFPSLPEIALADRLDDALRNKILSKSNVLDIYDTEHVNPYHKYIAIVHADGDNMGKVIANLKEGEYSHFSKKLFNYCSDSAEIIDEYGGETIFAGGDDLLFFAPVYNATENKNIFGLIDEISNIFNQQFEEENNALEAQGKTQATLSFGVSITYYKFPLYEALENSRELLFGTAKTTGEKNNIAFTVIKHSGQTFGGIISKNDKDIYDQFLSLLKTTSRVTDDENFLHSLHHKLYTYKVPIDNIAHDRNRLENFFNNFFSKELHRQFDITFAAMVSLIHASYVKGDSRESAMERVYTALRFVKFLKGDKS